MNLQLDRITTLRDAESSRLWHNGRFWFVNCTAVERAWPAEIQRTNLPEARRRRDAMLAAFLHESW